MRVFQVVCLISFLAVVHATILPHRDAKEKDSHGIKAIRPLVRSSTNLGGEVITALDRSGSFQGQDQRINSNINRLTGLRDKNTHHRKRISETSLKTVGRHSTRETKTSLSGSGKSGNSGTSKHGKGSKGEDNTKGDNDDDDDDGTEERGEGRGKDKKGDDDENEKRRGKDDGDYDVDYDGKNDAETDCERDDNDNERDCDELEDDKNDEDDKKGQGSKHKAKSEQRVEKQKQAFLSGSGRSSSETEKETLHQPSSSSSSSRAKQEPEAKEKEQEKSHDRISVSRQSDTASASEHPEHCPCRASADSGVSECFTVADKRTMRCEARECEASYECDSSATDMICMRRKTGRKVVRDVTRSGFCVEVQVEQEFYGLYEQVNA